MTLQKDMDTEKDVVGSSTANKSPGRRKPERQKTGAFECPGSKKDYKNPDFLRHHSITHTGKLYSKYAKKNPRHTFIYTSHD